MQMRSALCCASALALVLQLAACGSSDNETSGSGGSTSAGASSAGAPVSLAGGGNSAGGAINGGAGAATGGAPNSAGSGGAAAGAGGALTAGAGGVSAGGASGSAGSAGSAGSGGGTSTIPNTKVVMYMANYHGNFSTWVPKINFNKMTHLNLAFGTVKSGTNDWSMGANDTDVKALTKAAHDANVKVLVSIGGASDDIGIINRYHTESNIAPLVANLDALVDRLGLDGVDVDVERGNEMRTTGNFPKFMTAINSTFKPKGKLVTAALAQYIIEDAGTDATVLGWIKSLDFVNLMIYQHDMKLYTSELAWWKSKIGIANNKLTWGVIFDGSSNAALITQATTASKADGGVMAWELGESQGLTLWKVVQDAI